MRLSVLNKIKEKTFLLGVLTLPVYQTVNHWFFGVFLALSFLMFFLNKQRVALPKKYIFLILGIASFFLLKLFGVYHAITFEYGLKEVIRALPFLLYPLAIINFQNDTFDFKKFEKKVFYALSYGCVLTGIICWGFVLASLKQDDIPANILFGWKKSGSFLTQVLDLHPPYLGLLLVASIVFLLREVFYHNQITSQKKYINSAISIFLFVFLFNITARNSLFFLVLLSFVVLIYMRRWKLLLVPIISLLIATIVIINHPSQYYRIKMYRMLNVSETKFKEKRFTRLEGSWEVFKTSPIIGVGAGNDQLLRNRQYQLNNDTVALNKSLNSHNQLFEYLVAYGLIGGFLFIGVNLFFLIFFLRNKQYFYVIILCNILIATLTESTFERVLGIQYYAILISMAILVTPFNKVNTKKVNL